MKTRDSFRRSLKAAAALPPEGQHTQRYSAALRRRASPPPAYLPTPESRSWTPSTGASGPNPHSLEPSGWLQNTNRKRQSLGRLPLKTLKNLTVDDELGAHDHAHHGGRAAATQRVSVLQPVGGGAGPPPCRHFSRLHRTALKTAEVRPPGPRGPPRTEKKPPFHSLAT